MAWCRGVEPYCFCQSGDGERSGNKHNSQRWHRRLGREEKRPSHIAPWSMLDGEESHHTARNKERGEEEGERGDLIFDIHISRISFDQDFDEVQISSRASKVQGTVSALDQFIHVKGREAHHRQSQKCQQEFSEIFPITWHAWSDVLCFFELKLSGWSVPNFLFTSPYYNC
jgi:hypothetical protein